MQKTYQPKTSEINDRKWHLRDAKGQILGRFASDLAILLIGKNKVNYAPQADMGDWVVVTNAATVRVTGRKESQKVYYSHSGYPGGLKTRKFSQVREEHPEKIIKMAVKNMLPKNRLRKVRMARLRVFAGVKHQYGDKFNEKN